MLCVGLSHVTVVCGGMCYGWMMYAAPVDYMYYNWGCTCVMCLCDCDYVEGI